MDPYLNMGTSASCAVDEKAGIGRKCPYYYYLTRANVSAQYRYLSESFLCVNRLWIQEILNNKLFYNIK
jgi:hypothetical protein